MATASLEAEIETLTAAKDTLGSVPFEVASRVLCRG